MGRNPCSKQDLNRGAWIAEEDRKLAEYVKNYGETGWRTLPKKAGLNRCGKSCRLRWLNYLRPDIKRGNITQDEEELIIRMHRLLGNRWALIAGRLPGRTDNEIKNYWNTHLSKKLAMRSSSNSNSDKSMQRSCSFPAAVADRHKQQSRASWDIVQEQGEAPSPSPSPSPSRSQSCDAVELSESRERMAMSWLEEPLLNDFDIQLLNNEDAFNSSMETHTRIDFQSDEFSLENLLQPVIDNRIPKDQGETQTQSDVESIFKEIINEDPEWMQMHVVECFPRPPPTELQMLECLLSSEDEGPWPPHHDGECMNGGGGIDSLRQ